MINTGAVDDHVIWVQDDFVTVEWMEIRNAAPGFGDGIQVKFIGAGLASQVVLRNNLIHNVRGCGVGLWDDDGRVDVYNNIVYNATLCGVYIDPASLPGGRPLADPEQHHLREHLRGHRQRPLGVSAARTLLVRNNISVLNGGTDYRLRPRGLARSREQQQPVGGWDRAGRAARREGRSRRPWLTCPS